MSQSSQENKQIKKNASQVENMPDFESAMDTLDSLVSKLETGNLTLEQSLAEFEKGVQLSRYCQKALNDAEQRISILLNDVEEEFKSDSE